MTIPETLRVHLATDSTEAGYYGLDRERFENAGKDFPDTFRRLRPTYSNDEAGFVQGVRDADVLVGWKFPRPGLAERAPNLRWVQLIGAGVDHLYPLDWLPASMKLITASGVHTKKSFEYVLMGLIALHTRLPQLAEHQRRRTWKKIQTGTLPGKTALVIGLGAVGTGRRRGRPHSRHAGPRGAADGASPPLRGRALWSRGPCEGLAARRLCRPRGAAHLGDAGRSWATGNWRCCPTAPGS